MSISPFSVRPVSPETDRRRARLVLAIATIGIAATVLAYAISPGVRHAVGHAAHSVNGAVGRVLDHDKKASHATPRTPAAPPGRTTSTPSTGGTPAGTGKAPSGTTPTHAAGG